MHWCITHVEFIQTACDIKLLLNSLKMWLDRDSRPVEVADASTSFVVD